MLGRLLPHLYRFLVAISNVYQIIYPEHAGLSMQLRSKTRQLKIGQSY